MSGGAHAYLERRVQVVAGKGGVGRSVLASALAFRSARSGVRTLLLEVNAPDNCARYLDVAPAPDHPREVLNNLWLCRMTPVGALREYAMMVLKFKALYNFVFENPLVKYFLRSVPSLAEFNMMGKAWYHTTEMLAGGQPRYERVIIDAPATGHAITLLSVSRVVARTVPAGVMKDAATSMAEFVEDPDNTCLHIVATPEEMPINEAQELAVAANENLHMATGIAFVNRVLPSLIARHEVAVFERLLERAAEDPQLSAHVHAVERRRLWETWQAECIERLGRNAKMPVVEVPELGLRNVDRAFIERVSDIIEEHAQPQDDAPQRVRVDHG